MFGDDRAPQIPPRSAPAYVTKLLSGNNNFTIRTMTQVAQALRLSLKIRLTPLPPATHPRRATGA